MPEPFKNFYNPKMIALMARHFKRVWDGFDDAAFIAEAVDGMDALELKQRGDQIARALRSCLPEPFADAASIILQTLHPDDDIELKGTEMDDRGIRGWAILPMTQYVGDYGVDDFDLGMAVQKELTKRFTSEFGIRSFIIRDQDRALTTLAGWTGDRNYHVRRLVSEGSRPRLPWGMRLQALVEDPGPLFPILESLKDDSSEYVRRSVANSLNDIAKDHPDRIAETAKTWMKGATPERRKLVRHACRTLVKAGHGRALAALGYGKPEVSLTEFNISTPTVQFGSALRFGICLKSEAAADQNLVLDYAIHHRRANGKTSPKVFKWKTLTLAAGEAIELERKHALRPITTRRYYAGRHAVEILVNGQSLGCRDFELEMPCV